MTEEFEGYGCSKNHTPWARHQSVRSSSKPLSVREKIERVEACFRSIVPFSVAWVALFPDDQKRYDRIGWDRLANHGPRHLLYCDGCSLVGGMVGAMPLRNAPADIRVAALGRLDVLIEAVHAPEAAAVVRAMANVGDHKEKTADDS